MEGQELNLANVVSAILWSSCLEQACVWSLRSHWR